MLKIAESVKKLFILSCDFLKFSSSKFNVRILQANTSNGANLAELLIWYHLENVSVYLISNFQQPHCCTCNRLVVTLSPNSPSSKFFFVNKANREFILSIKRFRKLLSITVSVPRHQLDNRATLNSSSDLIAPVSNLNLAFCDKVHCRTFTFASTYAKGNH